MKDKHPKFMPKWTKVVVDNINTIKNWNFLPISLKQTIKEECGLVIADYRFCLIGEAHGLNSNDYANKCNFCGNQAFVIFDVLNTHDLKIFFAWKDRIYEHFKVKHPKLIGLKKKVVKK